MEEVHLLGPIMSWGWQFALTLGVLTWGGHWADEQLGTKALFVIIGIFMGLFGGFWRLYKIVEALPKPKKKTKKE